MHVRNKFECYCNMAQEFIRRWYETEHHIETGFIRLGTVDAFLKLIHREELACKKLALILPSMKCIQFCMIIYGETVYGECAKYHKEGSLHLIAAEAIRFLHYGQEPERERLTLLPNVLAELFEHIKIVLEAKEYAQMVDAGILQDADSLYLNQRYYSLSERDRNLLLYYNEHHRGKGLRLRIGTETTAIFSKGLLNKHPMESGFLEAIRRLLSEAACGKDIPLFKGTYYEFLPAVADCDSTYEEFLKELLERLEFLTKIYLFSASQYAYFYSSSKDNMAKAGRVMGAPLTVSKEIVKEYMIFKPEWNRWKIEEGNRIKILETPVIKGYDSNGITNFYIMGDSINAWVEEAVYRKNTDANWKVRIAQAIENQFEEEVVRFMRKYEFEAGQVEQNGVWHTGNDIAGNLMLTLPGEVDVLAVSHSRKTVYLIECKCLHDTLSVDGNVYKKGKSINKKLSGQFVQKIKKKREIILEYVERNLRGYDFITVILTDLEFPVYLFGDKEKEWEKIICICSFKELQKAVVKNKVLRSGVGHI